MLKKSGVKGVRLRVSRRYMWIALAVLLVLLNIFLRYKMESQESAVNNISAVEYQQSIVKPEGVSTPQNASEESVRITGEANPSFPFWDHGNISYSFDINFSCVSKSTAEAYQKIPRVRRAFSIISSETGGLVSFNEKPEGGDIIIRCYSSLGADNAVGVAGTKRLSNGQIVGAVISYYRNLGLECWNYPSVELHEALHTLGFRDSPDPSYRATILYNGFDGGGDECADLSFDKNVVECLKSVYSNGKEGSATCSKFIG